jgi:hypothetical protein
MHIHTPRRRSRDTRDGVHGRSVLALRICRLGHVAMTRCFPPLNPAHVSRGLLARASCLLPEARRESAASSESKEASGIHRMTWICGPGGSWLFALWHY